MNHQEIRVKVGDRFTCNKRSIVNPKTGVVSLMAASKQDRTVRAVYLGGKALDNHGDTWELTRTSLGLVTLR